MAKKDFIKKPKNKDFMVIPSIIFNDERLSISAKGLYSQLYYSSSDISSLEELVDWSTSSKEDIFAWFDELTKVGYITVDNKGNASFAIKTQSEHTVSKKLDQNNVDTFKNTVQEKPEPLSAYQKMVNMINDYKFSENITKLLIEYFENRLNKRGRFEEGEPLHGYVVRAMLNDLVNFNMSDEEMAKCVKNSIDNQWYKFFDNRKNVQNEVQNSGRSSFMALDKNSISSGSYTEDDIKKIKERAKELDAEGKKGTY